MIIHECAQGGMKWLRLRLGLPTSSEFDRIITPSGKLSTQAEGYMYRLLAEWMVGEPLENPETRWMERGSELESQAVHAYAFACGCEPIEVGFVTDDAQTMGSSPDRLVGEDGVAELKVPAPHTHVGYLCCEGLLEKTYRVQVQGELLVTERRYADLVSYCPGLPLVIRRCVRDEPFLAALRQALAGFTYVMTDKRAELERKYGPFTRTEPQSEPDGLGVSEEDIHAIMAERFPSAQTR